MDSYFKKFAPKKERKREEGKTNCVIYTRVSSQIQMESNGSLELQYRECTNFAIRKGFKILKYFGGNYESAKNDEERVHFSEMIDFVSNSRNKVKNVIIFEYSRFSRTGLNALSVLNTLNKNNINVYAVIGGIEDPRSEMGMMMLSLNLMMARYENKQKSALTIERSKNRLLQGYWIHSLPFGYSRTKDKTIYINDDGWIIKKGFDYFLRGYSPTEIRKLLKRHGHNFPSTTFHQIFRNPFYAGVMISKFLDYEPRMGSHPKIISIENFKRVQKIIEVRKYPRGEMNDFSYLFPQRGIVKCTCGNKFTAYFNNKKNLGYYKCSKEKCNTNVAQIKLDSHLCNKLANQIPREISQKQCYSSFQQLLLGLRALVEKDIEELEFEIKTIKKRMMVMTDRMLDNNLSEEIFVEKLNVENEIIEKKRDLIDALNYDWSNFLKDAEKVVFFLKNSLKLFKNGDLLVQRRIQEVLFKSSQVYSKKTDQYLTTNRNKIIDLINCITESFGNKKSEQSKKNLDLSALVPGAGIEPALYC